MNGYLIRGGRVIDPSRGFDKITDVLIEGDVIRAVGDGVGALVTGPGFETYDATGLVVVPGFVDLHVHFREPGTEGETIASGVESAVAGGFTTVCVMPNTSPAIDNGDRVSWQHERARERNLARVRVVGALTASREGKRPSDTTSMARAGVVALSDDGSGVQDAGVMWQAMTRAAELGLPVSDHAEDACLAGSGVINEGEISRRYGIAGKFAVAEEAMIARDIEIARAVGCHLHIAHLSTVRGIELVRRAKNDGVRITAEVTPHHLALTESDLVSREPLYDSGGLQFKSSDLDPNKKMNPPLRTDSDTWALKVAVKEGVIDAIATDHAPHPAAKKAKGIVEAPNGIVGLETAFSVVYRTFVEHQSQAEFKLPRLIETLTSGPAKIFGLDAGTLRPGAKADVAILNLDVRWKVEPEKLRSASKNTPWANESLPGRVRTTFVGGRIVYYGAGAKDNP